MRREQVLIVAPDPPEQQRLQAQLTALNLEVRVSGTGEDAVLAAAEFEPDVILLSLHLPDIDGVETCRRLREWSRVPILILDGKDRERLAVETLDAGADDFLTRPFEMDELLARIRAVLRRAREARVASGSSGPVMLSYRNLVVNLMTHRVMLDGLTLHLTPTEYALLRVLITHAGQVLTHRELLTRVWGPESATDIQYLHVYVPQLRRKLEPTPGSPRHILTTPGVGYSFSVEA